MTTLSLLPHRQRGGSLGASFAPNTNDRMMRRRDFRTHRIALHSNLKRPVSNHILLSIVTLASLGTGLLHLHGI